MFRRERKHDGYSELALPSLAFVAYFYADISPLGEET